MKLSKEDLLMLSRCAIAAAYQAGHLIGRHALDDVLVEKKQGGSSQAYQVVTEVDRAAQKCIADTLYPTCKLYDLAWLGEESQDDLSRLRKDFFWCVDPLDGTVPFVEKRPGYSVSIALVSKEGVPYIGVVYDPVAQSLLYAIKGQGCHYNENILSLETSRAMSFSQDSKSVLTVAVDKSFQGHPLFQEIIQEFEKSISPLGYRSVKTHYYGGAVMNASKALLEPHTCYFKFPRPQDGGGCLWDFAATACLFQEAGAHVTDIYGMPLELNRRDSLFMNHKGVLYTWDREVARVVMELFETFRDKVGIV